MKFKITKPAATSGTTIATRCPHCSHNGTFEEVGIKDVYENYTHILFGLRRCPNSQCHGQLFFCYDLSKKGLVLTYPSETIPFNKEGVPQKITDAFKEAVICHSNNCFIASAIMIRKTLEEMCLERGATGKNLFKRLEDLGSKILLPKELLEGMQELRLLGNDAAHIEANTYHEIGKNEIEISIEFTKEILKAVYQYEELLSRLRGLKKSDDNETANSK